MKLVATLSLISATVGAQTLYVPGGTGGIITNSPSTFLEFKTSNTWNGTIRANTDGAGQYSSFGLYENNSLRWALYNHPGISNTLLFANSSGQDKVAIAQDGSVGIGTISPAYKLDVSGNLRTTSFINASEYITVQNGSSYRVALNGQSDGYVTGRNASNADKFLISANGDSYLNGGKVGIGTSAPAFNLDVTGNLRTTSFINASEYITVQNGSSYRVALNGQSDGYVTGRNASNQDMFIIAASGNSYLNGGNVGIGIAEPAFKLDVEGWGVRLKHTNASFNSYTTFRMQGPDYDNGLEIDVFGNNNISSDLNWSYGGGAGSAAIVNVNAKPLTFGTNNLGRMLIDGAGNVAIGTFDTKGYKLAVAGKIISEEVVVKLQTNWPDYVFEKDYKLPSLEELQLFIAEHKHLPGVPSAKEVEEKGLSVGEMNAVLLKKIEELTMYILQQEKRINDLEKQANK